MVSILKKKPLSIDDREHRRWVVEKINSPLKEIQFIDMVLSSDNKNYHAWSYRQIRIFLIEIRNFI